MIFLCQPNDETLCFYHCATTFLVQPMSIPGKLDLAFLGSPQKRPEFLPAMGACGPCRKFRALGWIFRAAQTTHAHYRAGETIRREIEQTRMKAYGWTTMRGRGARRRTTARDGSLRATLYELALTAYRKPRGRPAVVSPAWIAQLTPLVMRFLTHLNNYQPNATAHLARVGAPDWMRGMARDGHLGAHAIVGRLLGVSAETVRRCSRQDA